MFRLEPLILICVQIGNIIQQYGGICTNVYPMSKKMDYGGNLFKKVNFGVKKIYIIYQ